LKQLPLGNDHLCLLLNAGVVPNREVDLYLAGASRKISARDAWALASAPWAWQVSGRPD